MACFSRTADAQLESQEAGAHRTMRTNDVPYTTLVTTVQPVAQGRPGEIGQIKRHGYDDEARATWLVGRGRG